MFTSFYSQNTGRFYPFDEIQVESRRDEYIAAYSECGLDILRQGMVDLGVLIHTESSCQGAIQTFCDISKEGEFFSVKITATCEEAEYELEFTFSLADGIRDFTTLKSSNGADVYGFLTLGFLDVWSKYTTPLVNVPVYRGCVKWLSNRQVNSLEILNNDRYIPFDECHPDLIGERPGRWSYGKITEGDIVFKAGYNCHLTFSETENLIQIRPVPLAGMGAVARPVGLGYEENGEFELLGGNERYDLIRERPPYAKSVAGAFGDYVLLSTDNNFVAETVKMPSPEENECDLDVLLITYVRQEDFDCVPILAAELPPCYEGSAPEPIDPPSGSSSSSGESESEVNCSLQVIPRGLYAGTLEAKVLFTEPMLDTRLPSLQVNLISVLTNSGVAEQEGETLETYAGFEFRDLRYITSFIEGRRWITGVSFRVGYDITFSDPENPPFAHYQYRINMQGGESFNLWLSLTSSLLNPLESTETVTEIKMNFADTFGRVLCPALAQTINE